MANELVNPNSLNAQIVGLSRLPLLRQLGAMIGLAGAVALGVAVVLWSREPGMRPLFSHLTEKDQARVVEELSKANIPHKFDTASGAVMVSEKHAHEARLKLASQGLPKGANAGYELMESGNNFGTSPLVENARYQHALEGELSRSIQTIRTVQNARVHLAIPKQSSFLRNRQNPSASVVVNLYPGRNLDEGQVAAIVHMVASSIPGLDTSRVTVVDQSGRLLTAREGMNEMQMSASQFDHTRRTEEAYTRRIETILTPIIGPGGVRAQVSLDMDYTVTEQTMESFTPDPAKLRSEQVAEERTLPGNGTAGIPGALSNQPPGPASVPETNRNANTTANANAKNGKATETVETASNTSRRATRNFELDRTISHKREAPGRIKRLTVAVVVDNKQVVDEDGELTRVALKPDELERLNLLVKEAVGFSAERNDSVQVTNIPFTIPPPPEELPEPTLLEQPWVMDMGKQALGGVLVLFILFGVLRPWLTTLATRPLPAPSAYPLHQSSGAPAGSLPGPGGPQGYESQLSTAKQVAAQDPRRVAQVVKNWVTSDA
jgi:flagellar M-ring protein FliF